MSSDAVFGYATFPDPATAEQICRSLVEEKLVTCANILATHRSIYAWEGELKYDAEVAAILKTSSSRVRALTESFRDLHPYDVPALAFLNVDGGEPAFLAWLTRES